LPIIETEEGDITAYIPTNVISITDGQAILDRELFLEGQRPAIDTSVSVSRLGGAVQPKMLKPVSSDLKVALVLVKRARALVQVSSEADLPDDKKQDLRVGRALDAVLKQGPGESRTPAEHVTLLQAALFRGGASFAGLSEEELGLAIKILSETLAKANPNVEDQSAGSLYPIKRIIASAIREERNLTQSEQIVVASAPIISGATTYRLRQESCSAV
jgi:F0F1-type ATP synthase alpha subunit